MGKYDHYKPSYESMRQMYDTLVKVIHGEEDEVKNRRCIMHLKEFFKKVVHWVEKHGASKVLDALEAIAEGGLDAATAQVPTEFKALAEVADKLTKDKLEAVVKKLEAKLEQQ